MAAPTSPDRPSPSAALTLWLIVCAVLCAAIVLVGGLTRLTESGLSITEWRPVSGIIPPLGDADWLAELEKYRSTTEYQTINRGMPLEAFKTIYWWEWGHRMLARLIGLAVLLPLIWFWARGALAPWLKRRGVVIFALVCLQGLVGWLMVQSGLSGRTDVSQYKLAMHLGLAFIIFGTLIWTLLDLRAGGPRARQIRGLSLAEGFAGLVYVQIILGALVAGTKAGLTENTWPLQDGQLVPDGLFIMSPWYVNFGENVTLIQFQHRFTAYALIALVAVLLWRRVRAKARFGHEAGLVMLTLAQMGLGIWALLYAGGGERSIALAAAHQFGAVLLFAGALTGAWRARAGQA